MPLKIPKTLPAHSVLYQNENIFVMDTERSMRQHIRPLKIAILNLMPLKYTNLKTNYLDIYLIHLYK